MSPPPERLATINAIWIGGPMGPVHAACLRSFVATGHDVILHGYDVPVDVPHGVTFSDAEKLLPRDRYFFRHKKTGSLAPFCDLLRYEILAQGLGLYVDCDVFCVSPIVDAAYIFGLQPTGSINNAVLKLPPECPALRDLLSIKKAWQFSPPWQPLSRRLKWKAQRLIGKGTLAHLPYGTTGPMALTWYLQKHGLHVHAKPEGVFYPVGPEDIAQIMDPSLGIQGLIQPETATLHLYNEALRQIPHDDPAPGCAMHQILNDSRSV
ncbi:MAG: hypothetical protein AAF666_18960 [Pseudomonadota bacterium]